MEKPRAGLDGVLGLNRVEVEPRVVNWKSFTSVELSWRVYPAENWFIVRGVLVAEAGQCGSREREASVATVFWKDPYPVDLIPAGRIEVDATDTLIGLSVATGVET